MKCEWDSDRDKSDRDKEADVKRSIQANKQGTYIMVSIVTDDQGVGESRDGGGRWRPTLKEGRWCPDD